MEKGELKQFSKDLDDVFDEKKSKKKPTKVAKPVKLEQKLKVLGWIAFTISFIGIILNAWKNILCWPVWVFANCFWIYWAVKKKEWAQVWLWATFTLANFYGWYMWY